MTFVTYAQNFEDVTLWRALKDVKRGFYIDVGASDPDADSVTRAFSERGWRGINIEPLRSRHARLAARRPRDVNLCVAVGEARGTAALHEVDADGLSTLDPALAARHAEAGFQVSASPVPVDTLAMICARHAAMTIHFMKLDCEGSERAALLGADFARFRPWIVLVEATEPNTQTPNHTAWEQLLLDARYGFAWFDGLNRFYVAEEHFARLAPLVAQPPNVFDGFSYPKVQAAGPVACRARLLELLHDTPLGAAGDRLMVPEDEVILPAVLANGAWMAEHTAFVGAHLPPEGQCALVDIGANCGLFTRQVLRALPRFDRVVCAEADADNHAALCRNLAQVPGLAMRLDQVALGEADGEMTLYRDAGNCGNYSLHPDAMRGRAYGTARVTVAAAGAWLEQALPGDQPIVWKSDTQGHDEVIVAAAPWPVWRRVQVAIVEVWRIDKGRTLPVGFLERVADMPHRMLGGKAVSAAAVAEYLASGDHAHDDLLMWR